MLVGLFFVAIWFLTAALIAGIAMKFFDMFQTLYPFGMGITNRKFSSNKYRYGFNGKENDNEVKGEGNHQDYGMRIYDPRLGKFLSVDLLTRKYAMLSPFQFASNRPIDGIDLDGLEFLPYTKSMYQLQYSTTTSTKTLGNGKQQTVTTENVVVTTVYANIPTSLQDSKTNSFKYVSGGPVTAWGRDWDFNKDGALIYDKGKYYSNGPQFNGLPPGAGEPSDRTKPNGKYYGDDVMTSTNLGKVGTVLSAFKEAYEIGENLSNTKTWDALGVSEPNLRKGFYNATNMVDAWKQNSMIGDKSLLNAYGRTCLVNFLTDGSLNTDFADNLKDEWRGNIHMDYSPIRKNIYEKALRVAYTGLQMMQNTGIEIRPPQYLPFKTHCKNIKRMVVERNIMILINLQPHNNAKRNNSYCFYNIYFK